MMYMENFANIFIGIFPRVRARLTKHKTCEGKFFLAAEIDKNNKETAEHDLAIQRIGCVAGTSDRESKR